VTAVAAAMIVSELFGHEEAKFTVILPGIIPLHTVDGNRDVQRGYAFEVAVIRVVKSRVRVIIVNARQPILYTVT
jgi:hypothetical protein